MDSSVALALWLEAGHRVVRCLCADHGQRAAEREWAAALAIAERFDLPLTRLDLQALASASRISGNALTRGAARALPEGTPERPGDDDSAAAVWVPARNVVLVAIAAAHAEAILATHVLVGWNCEEAVTFPDNSAEFCDDFDRLLARGTRNRVRVASPTLTLDKLAIARHAHRLGLSPENFWSCYRGDGDPRTCACESCLRSRRAWVWLG